LGCCLQYCFTCLNLCYSYFNFFSNNKKIFLLELYFFFSNFKKKKNYLNLQSIFSIWILACLFLLEVGALFWLLISLDFSLTMKGGENKKLYPRIYNNIIICIISTSKRIKNFFFKFETMCKPSSFIFYFFNSKKISTRFTFKKIKIKSGYINWKKKFFFC